ncbi:MAG: HNH endonuclease signature motif containing protein [Acidobacteriota bacterium]
MPRKIPAALQDQVRQRANYLCEYCHTNERWQYDPFTMDHILPSGEDTIENLALACFHCNRRKSDRQEALDPETGRIAPLFNPRQHIWGEHFIWSSNGLLIIPRTEIGRATVALLELNRDRACSIRSEDVKVNRHPPVGDPIEQ